MVSKMASRGEKGGGEGAWEIKARSREDLSFCFVPGAEEGGKGERNDETFVAELVRRCSGKLHVPMYVPARWQCRVPLASSCLFVDAETRPNVGERRDGCAVLFGFRAVFGLEKPDKAIASVCF